MKQELERKVAAAAKELFGQEVSISLTRPDEQFGDYATNVALQLTGRVGKNPREIAETLAGSLRSDEAFSEVSVAGPGFINLRLSNTALWDALSTEPLKNEGEVVIETNNPNPFKAMHIGHAFNAIVADAIANLLEVSGKTTHRVSYHGDVGQHVGRSMYSLLRFVEGNPEKLKEIAPEQRNTFMSRMYAEGTAAFKSSEEAAAEVNRLSEQSFLLDDPTYREVYEICKAWSFEQIDELVSRMGNKPIERRYLESEADSLGVDTVKAHVGDVFVESEGALVFPGSQHGSFDNVFVGSNGRGLYGARDLGLIQLKQRDYPYSEKSYIVTAEEQKDYFKGVFAAAGLILADLKDKTVNISTGTVKLSTGKMSSRDGNVLEIAWLFDQIKEAVVSSGGTTVPATIAGALRYEFLRVRVGSDVVFDVDEAVSIKGNSGPYLQYAYARGRSILNKAGSSGRRGDELVGGERSLASKIGQYADVVNLAVEDLMPHHICVYLYELAQAFNSFYEHNRVIGDERQDIRLGLVVAYTETLKKGLSILGIEAPEHM